MTTNSHIPSLEMLNNISGHVIPIYLIDRGRIDFQGSSVYLVQCGKFYLITAAHVIKRSLSQNLGIIFGGMLQPIPTKSMTIASHESVDLAVIELSAIIPGHTALDRISDYEEINKDALIVLAGYPQSRVKAFRTYSQTEIRFIQTGINQAPETSLTGIDPKVNFTCYFSKENTLFADGTLSTHPDPKGMSGGPAMELIVEDGIPTKYRLIGIMTDWYKRPRHYIRCTKSYVISQMISQTQQDPSNCI